MSKLLLLTLAATLLAGATLFLNQQNNLQDAPITDSVVSQWKKFKATYGLRFSDPDTEVYRLEIFADNLEKIANDTTGTLGITEFAALSQEEFAETYLTLQVEPTLSVGAKCQDDVAVNVDWRQKGAVTAVKNQARCGSCWAFSTTGSLESALIINGQANDQLDLSEQQLVDCSILNNGCDGGMMDRAFLYIKNNGITTNADYPYTATKTKCNKPTKDLYKLKNWTDVAQGCTTDLKIAVAQQPVSIAVDASNWSLYTGGVFSNCEASLNHGVLLVGYVNNTWIVKNSWGTSWGEKGYIYLADGNTCGLANVSSYPNV